jgi:hypothetical protein
MGLSPRLDKLEAGQNLLHNGGMDLFQRGISVSVSNAANSYLADRFSFRPSGLTATATMARSTDVPTQAQAGYQFAYSLGLTTTNQVASPGSTAVASLAYRMEGNDYAPIHSKACRLQFWVKSSVTGLYSVTLANDVGVAATKRQYVTSFTINTANTWEKKTFDITMDTTGTWLFDNTLGLDIRVNLQIGSGGQTSTLNAWQTTSSSILGASGHANLWAGTAGATFLMTGVALYEGSFSSTADLPFKRAGKTIGDELRICQRYYEKSYDTDVAPGTNTAFGSIYQYGSTDNSSNIGVTIAFKATKRGSTVNVVFYQTGGTLGSWVYNRNGGSGSSAVSVLIGMQGGLAYLNAGAAWVVANINGHYTAESEL